MDPKVKELWLKALRSGEYQQTHGSLKTTCGFCCLGVLTDLYIKEKAAPEGREARWERHMGGLSFVLRDGEGVVERIETFLPSVVAKWADVSGVFSHTSDLNQLVNMNDTGKTFSEIADHIERNF